jgi:hypothetical protein
MRSHFTIAGFAALAVLLGGCHLCVDQPFEQRLADCTNSTLRFSMRVQEYPPYQFVLGVPPTSTEQLRFRGEIMVSHGTGTVARVQIGSEDIHSCNWLPGLSGYILTWGRTNRAERLESFLRRGQTYDVEVHFAEQPPIESSLWLSSMGRVH